MSNPTAYLNLIAAGSRQLYLLYEQETRCISHLRMFRSRSSCTTCNVYHPGTETTSRCDG